MVRMTPAQYAKFRAAKAAPAKPRKANPKSGPPPLRERDVARQVIDFLQLQGWRCTRNQVGVFRTMDGRTRAVGARGTPDWRAERFLGSERIKLFRGDRATTRIAPHEVLYLEFKAPGKKLRPEQEAAIERLRSEGTPAVVADSYDGFVEWYREIGYGGKP